jgi:Mg/Co/Ni transporter MgtE
MSPRAAWRLENLGFREVYEYRPGKADWLAAGLPTETERARPARAGTFADKNVPTCGLSERVGDIARRVRTAGWDVCFVVNEERVLLGRMDARQLAADPSRRVEEVMKPGPSTYRPDVPAVDLRHVMHHRGIHALPITTSDGVLIGAICREVLDRVDLDEHET